MASRINAISPITPTRILILVIITLMLFGGNAWASDSSGSDEAPQSNVQGNPAIRPLESRRYQPTAEPRTIVEELLPRAPSVQTQSAPEEANIPLVRLNLPVAGLETKQMASKSLGGPQKIGFNRRIADFLQRSMATSSSWQWQTLQNGERVTRIALHSPGAAALRRGLRIGGQPPRSELRFSSAQLDPGRGYRVGASDVLQAIERNRNSGVKGGDRPDVYWSPTLEGDSAILEVRVDAQADLSKVDLEVYSVSHLVLNPKTSSGLLPNAAASCNLDVNCYSTTSNKGDDISASVAKIVFTTTEGTAICTGTLLGDRAGSNIPFFLTARHCITTAAEASSLETIWFYESSGCNAGAQSANTQTRSGGATLLETHGNNDMTLLRLNEQPPSGAVYAGWHGDAQGERYTAIHHPQGDWKKISFGANQGLFSCSQTSTNQIDCVPNANGTYFRLLINQGFTEQGSSGSGIFKENSYLVGTLTAGAGFCNDAFGIYGRFQVGYDNGIKKWVENTKIGFLENPQPASNQSGITILSGWACIPGVNSGAPEINQVLIEIDGNRTMLASYGTTREDTQSVCGDTNNGFGLLFNMSRLGAGVHALRVLADGYEIGRANFTVATLGVDYLRDVTASYVIPNFPAANQTIELQWQAHLQNFVIAARSASTSQPSMPITADRQAAPALQRLPADPNQRAASVQADATLRGFLENPQPASHLSGITLFSGWACQAGAPINRVTIEIDGVSFQAGHGTERPDTLAVCGGSNNGWGLLFNTNRLGDGSHTVRALVDGAELGRANFTVTTLGTDYLRGASGTYQLLDFPKGGDSVVITWQEHLQNFMIKEVNIR